MDLIVIYQQKAIVYRIRSICLNPTLTYKKHVVYSAMNKKLREELVAKGTIDSIFVIEKNKKETMGTAIHGEKKLVFSFNHLTGDNFTYEWR